MKATLTAAALGAALALALAGCQKDDKKSESKPAKTTDTAPTPKKETAPTPPPPPPAGGDSEGEIRPPTADDLAKYTEGLEGDGPLMARLDTAKGEINCELFAEGAPLTVANFVGLARGLHAFRDAKTGKVEKRPYFDGVIFHRVIPGFMIQSGDPLGVGTGGPGYKFDTEVSDQLRHDKPGTLSMANAGPNTNGSQFFITDAPTPKLDGGYNVFGRCKELDVIKAIASVETLRPPGGREKSRPVEDVVLNKVEIYRGKK